MDQSITIEPVVAVSPRDSKKNEWTSCCLRVDKNAVKYVVQVSILSGLIVFSATMLVVNPECESQRNYSSLLLFCLGILSPTPKMN
jgi:hypothetical protein